SDSAGACFLTLCMGIRGVYTSLLGLFVLLVISVLVVIVAVAIGPFQYEKGFRAFRLSLFDKPLQLIGCNGVGKGIQRVLRGADVGLEYLLLRWSQAIVKMAQLFQIRSELGIL